MKPNERDMEVAEKAFKPRCYILGDGGHVRESIRSQDIRVLGKRVEDHAKIIASYRKEIREAVIRECAEVVDGYKVVSGQDMDLLNEHTGYIHKDILALLDDSEEAE